VWEWEERGGGEGGEGGEEEEGTVVHLGSLGRNQTLPRTRLLSAVARASDANCSAVGCERGAVKHVEGMCCCSPGLTRKGGTVRAGPVFFEKRKGQQAERHEEIRDWHF
jgi:hypothetical protein